MKAVVLVGGFGTRLRPLTLTTPKQLLPLVDKPMIEYLILALKRGGVKEVVLSLGYKDDLFRAAYPEHCCGIALSYAVEPEPLDTAGAIRFAVEAASIEETFLVVNGDVLTDTNIFALTEQHHKTAAQATIALTQVEDPSRYGVVPTDKDGKVLGFVEKPARDQAPTNWINAGTYVLTTDVLAYIDGGRRVSIEREVFPKLAEAGKVWAMHSDSYWIDIGTPATYLGAQLDLINGCWGTPPEAISSTAQIADDAVVANSVVMAEARLASGATVTNSVIMNGAEIAVNARVDNSIIGPKAVVRQGAQVQQLSIVGDQAVVYAGQRLHDTKIAKNR